MPMDELFKRLDQSKFRRQFKLNEKDASYFHARGLAVILEHAREFLRERVAPANPSNDGSQTPMRGHPVFVAQHATGTCCRGCVLKWHKMAKDRALSSEEIDQLVNVIGEWLARQKFEPETKESGDEKSREPSPSGQLSLF